MQKVKHYYKSEWNFSTFGTGRKFLLLFAIGSPLGATDRRVHVLLIGRLWLIFYDVIRAHLAHPSAEKSMILKEDVSLAEHPTVKFGKGEFKVKLAYAKLFLKLNLPCRVDHTIKENYKSKNTIYGFHGNPCQSYHPDYPPNYVRVGE